MSTATETTDMTDTPAADKWNLLELGFVKPRNYKGLRSERIALNSGATCRISVMVAADDTANHEIILDGVSADGENREDIVTLPGTLPISALYVTTKALMGRRRAIARNW